MQEIWKDIFGFEGLYKASSYGKIARVDKGVYKILKGHVDKNNGYVHVWLYKNGKAHPKRLHVLILTTFEGKKPNTEVNHKNGIKTDNNIENLEWLTHSENMKHAHKIGLQKVKWNKKVIRISDEKIYNSISECANDNNVSSSKISKICNKNNKNKTFAFYEKYRKGELE